MLRWFGRGGGSGARAGYSDAQDDEQEDALELSLPSIQAARALDATAHHSAALNRPPAEERRRLERELILRFDARELRRGEAWCLVETPWLDAWMAYVLAEDDADCPVTRPGPLTNASLFDQQEYCLRKGLEATTHYRGVNPQVYALYAELYGTAGAKPIVRWTLDIYATPVMIDDVHEMLHAPELKARVEVAALHDKFNEYASPLQATAADRENLVYRWCCRCEYLVPCLNRLLGGGPTYKKDEDAGFLSSCCKKKKKKTTTGKSKKKSKRRRRRSYDFDEDGDEDEDTDGSQEEIETRGLLG